MRMHISPPFIFFLLFSIAAFASADMSDSELKRRMIDSYFYTGEGETWQEFNDFKELSAVTGEQLHRVLMDIYREAENKLLALAPDTEEWNYNLGLVDGVIRWLPKCKGIPVKDFLLAYAASEEKHHHARQAAILSYLRVANAEEARDILLKFLVGKDRMGEYDRSSIYRYPRIVWDTVSPEKRAAMFNALCEAAAVESVQWAFDECDSQLIAMCPAYRDSLQRKGMLKRQLSVPFPKYYSELKEKMEKEVERLEKLEKHTSVNTNLATAIARDFNQPLPEEGRIALETPPDAPDTTDAAQEKSTETGRKSFYALAAIAGLLGVLALWFGLRRKRGPA